jgi:hypothetical protein
MVGFTGAILSSKGHLTVSGDTVGTAKHPTGHRVAKNYPAKNINSAKFEKPKLGRTNLSCRKTQESSLYFITAGDF